MPLDNFVTADNGLGWPVARTILRYRTASSVSLHTKSSTPSSHTDAAAIQMTRPNRAKTAGLVSVSQSASQSVLHLDARWWVAATVSAMHQSGVPRLLPPTTHMCPPAGGSGVQPVGIHYCTACTRCCILHTTCARQPRRGPSEVGLNRPRTGRVCAPCDTRRGRPGHPGASRLAILRGLSGTSRTIRTIVGGLRAHFFFAAR
jgi:hypothetical protein